METTFNVSNTDVITMLVVEQREVLQKKRNELRIEYVKKIAEQTEKEHSKLLQSLKKNKQFQEGFDALVKLFTILNPKLKLNINYEQRLKDQVFNFITNQYDNFSYNVDNKLEFNDIDVVIETEDEDDQDKLRFPWSNGYEDVFLPFKYKSQVKVDEKTKELSKEINKINDLLRNEASLKEKLIATVTKNAIKELPEMKALVGNINLLTY